jgi:hypothetical protein
MTLVYVIVMRNAESHVFCTLRAWNENTKCYIVAIATALYYIFNGIQNELFYIKFWDLKKIFHKQTLIY